MEDEVVADTFSFAQILTMVRKPPTWNEENKAFFAELFRNIRHDRTVEDVDLLVTGSQNTSRSPIWHEEMQPPVE